MYCTGLTVVDARCMWIFNVTSGSGPVEITDR